MKIVATNENLSAVFMLRLWLRQKFSPAMLVIRKISFIVQVAGVVFFFASPVWAVQAHGGAEGLVSHQIGHLLFVIGMGFLLFKVYMGQISGPGWTEFKVFLWFILLWNCLTFSGHWLREYVDHAKFIQANGHTVAFTVTSFSDAYFYLTRLDHLLLVPSFLFLLLALRKWRQQ